MTQPQIKTCQRCHKPTKVAVLIYRAPQDHLAPRRLAEVCPLCYVQLLAWLHENLEVVNARSPNPHVP